MTSFSQKYEVSRNRDSRVSRLGTLHRRKRAKIIEKAKTVGTYAVIVFAFWLILFIDSF